MRVLLVPLVLVTGCIDTATDPVSTERAQGEAASTEAQDTGPIGCALRGEATCEQGKVPNLTVTLINQTGADVYLVGSLDASDCQWRYPFCYFEVIGPSRQLMELAHPRCGNMNTLREQDFVKVPPGGTFDPYQHIDSYGFFGASLSPKIFNDAGTYRIRFVYSSNCDDIRAWGGDRREEVAGDERLLALFAQVPKVEVRSNEFKVLVVAPAE
jgi:hypothetical protein